MNSIEKLLRERSITDPIKGVKTPEDLTKRQDEIRQLLAKREYGEIPPSPEHMYTKSGEPYEGFAAGKATRTNHTLGFEMDGKSFSFPMMSVIPNGKKKCPAFVFISFEGGEANKYMPTEEIVERGYALFTFCYKDVSSDDNNFKSGIAKHLAKSRRKNDAPSKIALWAWAAMRVMDYIETLGDVIDLENVAVIGHSRLGKTALVAGGYDTRFKYVISNDSGCAGAAIESGKVGERYDRISRVFPFWFCPAFNRDVRAGAELPFDQNFLLTLSVPRCLIVGSASLDLWADPTSELLGVASLDKAYEICGKRGLVHRGELPTSPCVLDEGDAVYYMREGTHYLSRHDWNTYMDIIDKKRANNR